MRARLVVPLLAFVLCWGCTPGLRQCFDDAITAAVGGVARVTAREAGADVTRPDEGGRFDGGVFFSVGHGGGRLGLDFTGEPRAGALPRVADDTCVVTDFATLSREDGGLLDVRLTVEGLAAEPLAAGTRYRFTAKAPRAELGDGGVVELGDRAVDVVVQ